MTTRPTIPCSTSPTCPASTRSGPSTSRRRSTQLLAEADAALERGRAPRCRPTTTHFAVLLDGATERLGRAWGAVEPPERAWPTRPSCAPPTTSAAQGHRVLDPRSGGDERLYAKYKAIAASPHCGAPDAGAQARIDNALRDFVLAGAELHGRGASDATPQIQERQAELSQTFSRARARRDRRLRLLRDAKRARRRARRRGAGGARRRARRDGKDGYKLTLQCPSYFPVMQFARQPRPARAPVPRLRHRAPASPAPTRSSTTRALHRARSWRCATKKRSCSAIATSPRCRWCRRWPTRRSR